MIGDRETWAPALGGVGAAYVTYYPDLAIPSAADTVGAFADLAVKRGVRRLVLLSGRGEEGALVGEQAVQNSGADWSYGNVKLDSTLPEPGVKLHHATGRWPQ